MEQALTKLPIAIGALVAALLQLILAPNIHIAFAVPNFILCYVIVVAVANARNVGFVMPFVLGLLYDFFGSGPVGAMAFVCVAITMISALVFRLLDNETVFIPIVIIICSVFIADVSYALLMIACGADVSLLDALLYAGLPDSAYDIVLSLITYPIAVRFVFRGKRQNEMKIIDSRID